MFGRGSPQSRPYSSRVWLTQSVTWSGAGRLRPQMAQPQPIVPQFRRAVWTTLSPILEKIELQPQKLQSQPGGNRWRIPTFKAHHSAGAASHRTSRPEFHLSPPSVRFGEIRRNQDLASRLVRVHYPWSWAATAGPCLGGVLRKGGSQVPKYNPNNDGGNRESLCCNQVDVRKHVGGARCTVSGIAIDTPPH